MTICDFALWPERDPRGAFQIPMLSLWRMQEQHRGALGLPQLRFAFLELPKYEAADAPRTLVEKWAYFFRESARPEPALATLGHGSARAPAAYTDSA